jgi:HEAT repeat protein
MLEEELIENTAKFRAWAVSADQTDPGWQSDFPEWTRLLDSAKAVMRSGPLTNATVELLAECWAASEELEELHDYAVDHIDECWPAVKLLTTSDLFDCRWQAYDAAAAAGSEAESTLRQGLQDPVEYVRRRALVALARLGPRDAKEIAEPLLQDPNPHTRQAAIVMVMVAGDEQFKRQSLEMLLRDPVEHVRKVAEAALQKASGAAKT